jgi:2-polyprenyl-3-methyl-5-hydroxy-6-metoxy-1,4-benzoquinol methylase
MTGFERQWQSRFEKFATRHRAEHLVSGWSAAGLRRRVAVFEELIDRGLLAPGVRVLELGCGAGTYVRLLAKRGHPVVGLDYSLPGLRRAVAADLPLAGGYVAGDASDLPFRSGSFKAVACIGVLQALEKPETALTEIARVLEPGGVALVETLNPWNALAASRRLSAFLRRQPTRLRYASPGVVERTMASRGLRPVRRLSILLPPRSLPGLEGMLGQPWLIRALETVPGVRALAPQAYWIVGVKA